MLLESVDGDSTSCSGTCGRKISMHIDMQAHCPQRVAPRSREGASGNAKAIGPLPVIELYIHALLRVHDKRPPSWRLDIKAREPDYRGSASCKSLPDTRPTRSYAPHLLTPFDASERQSPPHPAATAVRRGPSPQHRRRCARPRRRAFLRDTAALANRAAG